MAKTNDTAGKPWAKLSETKAGDILIADGGFTCIREGARLVVERDEDGDLVVPCDDGVHLLDGQADDGETLIGLYPDDQGRCAGGVEIGVGACKKCGATDDDVCPEEARQQLRHSSPERESLWAMLDAYWGKGDGNPPPAFIARAAKLCGYPIQPTA